MRRKPKQQRSEQTVDKIKQAMREIVLEKSYAAATTNEIARRAGANISSLYFFFPNREAIAQAIFEETSLKIAQVTHRLVLQSLTKPLKEGMTDMVTEIINALDEEQAFLQKLIEQVPDLRETANALEQERLGRHVARLYIEHHLGKQDEEEIACKLFFVQHLSFDLMRRYVVERPDNISRDRFITELSSLVTSYLTAQGTPAVKKPQRAARRRS